MNTIYLTAGHQIINGKGTGAHSQWGDEAVQAKRIVDRVSEILRSRSVNVSNDKPSDPLGTVVSWLVGRVNGSDIVCDIHFNAAGTDKANGTEVIIPKKYTQQELELASHMAENIKIALGTKLRSGAMIYKGVKTEDETPHKTLGMLSKPYKAKNILVEVCFLTNKDDIVSYFQNFEKLCTNIADVLCDCP